jgi:hypothetical protein
VGPAETAPAVTRRPEPPGVRGGDDGGADAPARRRPAQVIGGGVARVDVEEGEIEVGVAPGEPAWRGPAAGEQDRHLVAAQVVGQGQDASWREHQAGPATGPAPEPDDGGGDLRDELLEGHLPPHGVVTC